MHPVERTTPHLGTRGARPPRGEIARRHDGEQRQLRRGCPMWEWPMAGRGFDRPEFGSNSGDHCSDLVDVLRSWLKCSREAAQGCLHLCRASARIARVDLQGDVINVVRGCPVGYSRRGSARKVFRMSLASAQPAASPRCPRLGGATAPCALICVSAPYILKTRLAMRNGRPDSIARLRATACPTRS